MSDVKYLQLLEELNRYDYELEQLQHFFSSGFNQLSRANYHNKNSMFGGNYGSMYYDMNYEGQLYVEMNDKDHKVDILHKKQSIVEPQNAKEEAELKQRGLHNSEKNESTTEEEQEEGTGKKKGPYDPIKMFAGGFSVPRTLRQCQSDFKSSIPLIQQLINRRNDILKLVQELEDNKSVKGLIDI